MVTERQDVPKEFTRTGNTDHRGVVHPVEDKKIFQYGTAGFRADSSLLPFIVYRMGYLAGLRSRFVLFVLFPRPFIEDIGERLGGGDAGR